MKKEILVIDDSKPIRFLLHTILKKHYKVISVPDGLSAMYYLRKETNPDLIILDPDLPDMPDWELVRHLSTSFFYNSIPVIVISNQSMDITREHASKYRVQEFCMKPFNPLRILEAVDNIIIGSTVKL
jgi:CheY-like chemotaxis protein